MITGRDLIGYTLNNMSGDKLTNLCVIAEEIGQIESSSITRRAISLINPYNQYRFLEDIILEAEDFDKKLTDFLNSHSIPLPVKYGWRHTCYYGEDKPTTDWNEWYDDKCACYRLMYKDAMEVINDTIDSNDNIPVTVVARGMESITIECGDVKDVYELYEM